MPSSSIAVLDGSTSSKLTVVLYRVRVLLSTYRVLKYIVQCFLGLCYYVELE